MLKNILEGNDVSLTGEETKEGLIKKVLKLKREILVEEAAKIGIVITEETKGQIIDAIVAQIDTIPEVVEPVETESNETEEVSEASQEESNDTPSEEAEVKPSKGGVKWGEVFKNRKTSKALPKAKTVKWGEVFEKRTAKKVK